MSDEFKFDLQLFNDVVQPETDTAVGEVGGGQDIDVAIDQDGNIIFFDEEEEETTGGAEPTETPDGTEPNDEPKKFTVTIDGQQVEMTEEELINGYLRQSDYTRKAQELAEQRRQLEALRTLPQEQPQQLQVQPPTQQPQLTQKEQYEKLANAIVAAIEDEFKEPYNELNVAHQVAFNQALQTVNAEVQRRQEQQATLNAISDRLRTDVEFQKLDEFASQYLAQLPLQEGLKYYQGIASGDTQAYLDFLVKVAKPEFDKRNTVLNNPPLIDQAQPVTKRVPYVEPTGAERGTPVPKYNLAAVKGKSIEAQADILKSLGII